VTTARELDERYGRTPRRRLPWVVGGALALALVVAFGWMTVAARMSSVDADDIGFTVIDSHSVHLRFQYSAHSGSDVVCAVQALDEEFGVVGWRIIEIPGSDSGARAHEVTIPTTAMATTGLVKSCWVA